MYFNGWVKPRWRGCSSLRANAADVDVDDICKYSLDHEKTHKMV